ncbi:PREDICTED: uncharacterized protein LOC109179546 [Ipomoea nil]|uniref:uncharacterized protein LOC109179546 n=1 Tax=Ipomoea nil TaxID=35883 RepID=UPI000900C632|nr:PREDICTED: uncharacterized protein LOC109179546 [Ipomoea nil]
MGFDGLFVVERNGLGGDLVVLWRDSDMATLIGYSDNHIDVAVSLPANHDEKRGGAPHLNGLIAGFNAALQDCDLFDLGMVGHLFTWVKGRGTANWLEERLDRALATPEWCEIYSSATVLNMLANSSDHSALYLDPKGIAIRRTSRVFWFESAWLLDVKCKDVVESSWRRTTNLSFLDRIDVCGQSLWRWGKEHFWLFGRRVQQLRDRMEVLRGSSAVGDVAMFLRLDVELSILLTQEELYWRQRSKQLWLQEGDLNTKYFHHFASHRRKCC